MSRPVLVTGATGAQGGSVTRALRERGVSVRAFTRDPRSQSAQALTALGAELIAGDLSDAGALASAIQGTRAVFGLTNYWEHGEREVEHGKNLVDAAGVARVPHLILSTLASSEELSGGELHVPHLETKARIERYARASSVPTTFVRVSYYYENFLSWFAPRRGPDGSASFGFPQGDAPLAAMSVEDVGLAVAELIVREGTPGGTVVGLAADDGTGAEYAASMSRALGETVRYQHIPREVFAGFGFPGAADLAAMFELNRRFVPRPTEALALTRRLNPGALRFDEWVTRAADRLRAAVG